MEEKKLFQVSPSPHMHSNASTTRIMLDVIIALLPAAAMSAVVFGARAALVIVVGVASSVAFEALWCILMKKPMSIADLSAVVTGLLLCFNLPVGIPLWQVTIGAFIAIIIVKQLFGGLGRNFANPALVGRVAMVLSFPAMTSYGFPVLDATSSATPLAVIRAGGAESLRLTDLLFGYCGGVLGETCALALIAGGIYLCIRKVINPIIPLCFVGTVFGLTALGGAAPLHSILSGGLMLGAIFMATDYVTSPYTNLGKAIFAVGCGLITVLIRLYGNLTEGVSFAILLMNLLVPYINGISRKKPFGGTAK